MQNLFTLKNQKKILSLFKGKGGSNLNPLKYLNQYCNVKLALIIEGIFISKTVVSLQIKVHECYVKELEPRKSLITAIDSSSDNGSESEDEEIKKQEIEELLLLPDEEK